MASAPKLSPLIGAGDEKGIQYEVKMAALVVLRALRLRNDFHVFRNVSLAWPFDDLVVRITAGGATSLVCAQLKHAAESDKHMHMQAFTPKNEGANQKGKFNLRRYFGFCEKLFNIHGWRSNHDYSEDEKYFREVPVDRVWYLIYTNLVCKEVQKNTSRSNDENSHLLEELFRTNPQSPSFNFNESSKEIWDLFGDDEKGQLYRKHFLSHLRVFHGQAHVTELDEMIGREIAQILGTPLLSDALNQQVSGYFLQEVALWAQKNTGECLHSQSHLLEKAVAQELRRQALEATKEFRFAEEHSWPLKCKLEQVLRERAPRQWKLSVLAAPPGVRAAKLLQVLDGHQDLRRSWLYLSNTALDLFSALTLKDAMSVCDVIIIDTDNPLNETAFQVMVDNCVSRNDKCVIFLADHQNPDLQEIWKLQHLTQDCQTRMLECFVNFQGQRIALKQLMETWPEMREQVSVDFMVLLQRPEGPVIGEDMVTREGDRLSRRVEHPRAVDARLLSDAAALLDGGMLALGGFPRKVLQHAARRLGFLGSSSSSEEVAKAIQDNDRWTVTYLEDEPPKTVTRLALEEMARAKRRSSLHYLVYVHGDTEEEMVVFWKDSSGDKEVMRRYIKETAKECHETKELLCIHSCTSPFILNLRSAYVIGEPGDGKSMFMEDLASKIKEDEPTEWVILVRLLNYRSELKDWPDVNDVTWTHVEELLRKAANATLGAARLCLDAALRRKNGLNVFVDGIDEVAPAFRFKALRLVHLLLDAPIKRVWVSSRPELNTLLGRLFWKAPLTLHPLTKEEQKLYLRMCWTSTAGEVLTPERRTTWVQLAESQVEEVVQWLAVEADGLLANLLHLRMAAEMFRPMVCVGSRVYDLKSNRTLLELYRYFVGKKRQLWKTRYSDTIDLLPVQDSLETLYEDCAIYYLFSDSEHRYSLNLDEIKKGVEKWAETFKGKQREGILWFEGVAKVHFCHGTFAEYFAAVWFWRRTKLHVGGQKYVMMLNKIGGKKKSKILQFLEAMLAEQ